MAQSSDNGTDGENLKIPPNSLEAEQSIFNLTEQKDTKIYSHIEPILAETVKKLEGIAMSGIIFTLLAI